MTPRAGRLRARSADHEQAAVGPIRSALYLQLQAAAERAATVARDRVGGATESELQAHLAAPQQREDPAN